MNMTDIDEKQQAVNEILEILGIDWPPRAGVASGWVAKPPSDALMDMQRHLTQAQYKAAPGLDNAIKAHSRTPEPTARMGNEWT